MTALRLFYSFLKTGFRQTVRIDESIAFIDTVCPTLTTKISHGWIRTDQDKVIETTGNRRRLNIIVALNLSDISATIIHDYESINNEAILLVKRELSVSL